MAVPRKVNFTNEGARYFSNLCDLVFLAGFPNFWVEDLKFSKKFVKYYSYFSMCCNGFLYVFIVFEWAAWFTQHNLTPKQSADSLLFNYAHPILFSYRLIITYHQEKIKDLVFRLFLKLKEDFNDKTVEKEMIRKSKVCCFAFLGLCSLSLFLYGFEGLYHTLKTDATFTTVITGWPDVEEKSLAADVIRGISYISWWMFMSRVFASYSIVLSLMVALEHQFKNLREYFRGLHEIFEEDLSQAEKERKYEEGINVGIKLHGDTLKCVQQAQDTCSTIYCLQILLNVSVLVSLMSQMLTSERTVVLLFTVVSTAITMLLSTGFFMWTAGDVTVEAAALATDMYWSGWQNCYGRAVSVRKLLTVAMAQAQIVRSSYSIFTVLY